MSKNRIDGIVDATTEIHAKLMAAGFSEKAANAITPGALCLAGLELVASEIEVLRGQQAIITAVEAIKILKERRDEMETEKKGSNGVDRPSK